jgi:hypothetical protein
MASQLRNTMDFDELRHLACLPGELPVCDICGQRPDSITFSPVDCKAGCLVQLELAEQNWARPPELDSSPEARDATVQARR